MNTLRILHTSDWHIGQRLHGKEREKEHQLFFDWLLTTLDEQKIDVLVVAGDIFDVGYPSNSALQLYYQFLNRSRNTNCQKIIITGGNHDYISTLNAPKQLLEALDIEVMGGVPEKISDEVIPIRNEESNVQAVVCAVPYLRDRELRQSVAGESHEDRIEALRKGILHHYQELAEEVKDYPEIPVIATGHLYLAGSSVSDSERDIHIGNLAQVSSAQFPEVFNYIALGHIHRPQIVGGNEHIRYCGSPIPLSFSERKDDKQVVLVEFSRKEISRMEALKVPAARKLIRFTGTLEQVREELSAHQSQNESGLQDWIELKIEEESYDPEAVRKYRELIEQEFDLEIIKPSITFLDKLEGLAALCEEQTSLMDLDTQEVFEKLLDSSAFDKKEELTQSYHELIELMNSKEEA